MSEQAMMPVELPQTGLMRWVRTVSVNGAEARAEVAIEAGHVFVRDGVLMGTALMEVMAQTAAGGMVVMSGRAGKRLRRGVLAAVREFEVLGEARVPCVLEVLARREQVLGALAEGVMEVRVDGALVARGRMTFHVEFD